MNHNVSRQEQQEARLKVAFYGSCYLVASVLFFIAILDDGQGILSAILWGLFGPAISWFALMFFIWLTN